MYFVSTYNCYFLLIDSFTYQEYYTVDHHIHSNIHLDKYHGRSYTCVHGHNDIDQNSC